MIKGEWGLQTKRITVFVDDQPVVIENAFSLEHAILRLSQKAYEDVMKGLAWIEDPLGNQVGTGGSLVEGMSVYVRYPKKGK
jgi:hypothetical protein